ncbi:hypothetical protein EDC56_1214 [Sinobacterium caligoides]|uniref:Phage protein U n=1 Tax=Sinobacterium caligoides TaxID=933926 RepID=A0A3N2E0P3_9GAMM|nr:phage tail protein [Sinobacterium caligoides]ROS05668.1 hypothetical protein EDC56_1214 [Sinobacterium caligoides]
MSRVMMTLGVFPFYINTASYEQLQHTASYQWAEQKRLNRSSFKHVGIGGPSYQYMGPGEQTVNLNGTIYPQYKGERISLSALRLSASLGVALPLINAKGLLFGRWFIEKIDQSDNHFYPNGEAKKICFSLTIKRYNEDVSSLPGIMK